MKRIYYLHNFYWMLIVNGRKMSKTMDERSESPNNSEIWILRNCLTINLSAKENLIKNALSMACIALYIDKHLPRRWWGLLGMWRNQCQFDTYLVRICRTVEFWNMIATFIYKSIKEVFPLSLKIFFCCWFMWISFLRISLNLFLMLWYLQE